MADWMQRRNLNVDFGEKVRLFRKNKGWTQEEMAEYVGCSSCVVSRIESGKISGMSRSARLCYAAIQSDSDYFSDQGQLDKKDLLEHMKHNDDVWVTDFFNSVLYKRESEREDLFILRCVWDTVVLYHETGEAFWDDDSKEDVRQVLGRIVHLREQCIEWLGSSKELDAEEVMLLNLFCVLLFETGSKVTAIRLMEKLIAHMLLDKREIDRKNMAVAALYNNCAFMKLVVGDYRTAGNLIAQAWNYVPASSNGPIVLSLFRNHVEVCEFFRDMEGKNKAQVAVETIVNFSGTGKFKREVDGSWRIDRVIFVF